jgi:hypothetical protein
VERAFEKTQPQINPKVPNKGGVVRPQSGVPSDNGAHVSAIDYDMSRFSMKMRPWNPNEGYIASPSDLHTSNNLYTLLFPFQNIGDQLDSEIMPLRMQWAAQEQKSELDPNSESWQRFKKLYSFQFGEQKTIGLFAPELSFQGDGENTTEQYNFGRYLRVVYLYVKPAARNEFEGFVHKYIVPAAEQILAERDRVTNAPPLEERTYWRFPKYLRKVSINVNMPTIPEFELFIQQQMLTAARDTNTPVLTYRTVTGDKHNYHLLFPVEEAEGMHSSKDTLMASLLMREHQVQLAARRQDGRGRFQVASLAPSAHREAVSIADGLAEQFHSHAIQMEEIVYLMRPDLSASLKGRYSKESVQDVWDNYNKLSKNS